MADLPPSPDKPAVLLTRKREPRRSDPIGSSEKAIQRLAAAIGALFVIGGAIAWFGDRLFDESDPPEVSLQATEIIIDGSAGMNLAFGETTKLRAAIENVRHLVSDRAQDSFALRQYGGACTDRSQLLERFRSGNHGDISRALKKVTPDGQANLLGALTAASSDFNDPRTRVEGGKRTLVVVVGSEDQCARGSAELADVAKRFKEQDVEVEWRFVALSVAPQGRAPLDRIVRSVGGETHYVDTEAQLRQALEQIIVEQPSVDELDSLTDYVNTTVSDLNETNRALYRDDTVAAQKALDGARQGFAESEQLYAGRLGSISDQARYRSLYPIIRSQRERQEDLISLQAKAIQAGKDARKQYMEDIDQSIADYNKEVSKLDDTVARIVKELSSS